MVIDNYPEGWAEEMEAVNNPEDAASGSRKVPFSRVIYIEQEDFREDPSEAVFPPDGWTRGAPLLRLPRHRTSVVKDRTGSSRGALHLRSGHPRRRFAGRAQGEIDHPLGSAEHAVDAEVRIYDTLFTRENPNEVEEGQEFTANLNPKSLEVATGKLEPSWRAPPPGAAISSNGWDISASIRIPAGKAGLQSHRGAARYVGQNRKAGYRQVMIAQTQKAGGGVGRGPGGPPHRGQACFAGRAILPAAGLLPGSVRR